MSLCERSGAIVSEGSSACIRITLVCRTAQRPTVVRLFHLLKTRGGYTVMFDLYTLIFLNCTSYLCVNFLSHFNAQPSLVSPQTLLKVCTSACLCDAPCLAGSRISVSVNNKYDNNPLCRILTSKWALVPQERQFSSKHNTLCCPQRSYIGRTWCLKINFLGCSPDFHLIPSGVLLRGVTELFFFPTIQYFFVPYFPSEFLQIVAAVEVFFSVHVHWHRLKMNRNWRGFLRTNVRCFTFHLPFYVFKLPL